MARIFYYVTIVAGIFALFTIMGMPGSTTSALLNAFGSINPDSTDYQGGDFWSTLFHSGTGLIALLAGLGTGAYLGFFTRQSFSEIAIAGFVATLGGWIIGDMYSVLKTMKAQIGASGSEFLFIYNAMWFLFIIFIVGCMLSLISWWRNSET